MSKKKKSSTNSTYKIILTIIAFLTIGFGAYFKTDIESYIYGSNTSVIDVPDYATEEYIFINNNIPSFDESDYNSSSFESYSELDSLDRCGVSYANIGQDLMPTEDRKSIGTVMPSGWQTLTFDIVPGKYLYNRCHLIGFQLTGENANEKNLITCTRQMNTETMLEFENKVADYIKDTGNHVLYRVTPVYDDNNLIAKGVQMEAYSIEDKGEGISFNIFVYNVQEGIEIDYADGSAALAY